MFYDIETPQYRLHQSVMTNLSVLARRYSGSLVTKVAPPLGTTEAQRDSVERLTNIATGQLSDYWDWRGGESVTAALARNGGELCAVLDSWASAVRACLEAETFSNTRAGRDGRKWLLTDLTVVEEDIEKLAAATALLSKTHLLMESHFVNAVSEANRLEAYVPTDVSGSDPVAVFTLAIDELYRPLREAWREYFLQPSEAALANYTTAAEALHEQGSPLVNSAFSIDLRPTTDEIAQTEASLDRLIAASLSAGLEE